MAVGQVSDVVDGAVRENYLFMMYETPLYSQTRVGTKRLVQSVTMSRRQGIFAHCVARERLHKPGKALTVICNK